MTLNHTHLLGGISLLMVVGLALVLFAAVNRAGDGDGGIAPLQGPLAVENLY